MLYYGKNRPQIILGLDFISQFKAKMQCRNIVKRHALGETSYKFGKAIVSQWKL